jgi:chloramphenicol-sensitive protein RarD
MESPITAERRQSLDGAFYATVTYSFWGLVPIYWKFVAHIPPLQMVAHRALWSLLALLPLLLVADKFQSFRAAAANRKLLLLLLCSSLLICSNWLGFIWAVNNKLVLQCSLGYFMNPLVNVVLGRIFFKEHLRPAQMFAFLLAVAAVIALTIQVGTIPWISIFLALSFSAYGAVRKVAPVESLVGLSIETMIASPFALFYLGFCAMQGDLAYFHNSHSDLLVALAGPVTTIPLLSFASAAKRLRYSTLGFFQYLSPTLQFLLAVFAFKETFTSGHLCAFAGIWVALGIYLIDSLVAARRARLLEELRSRENEEALNV